MKKTTKEDAVSMPTVEEIARVDAWKQEQRRIAELRHQDWMLRRPCIIHGPSSGRILYGPAPYGYGPVCKHCRREWSRQNGGKPWESEQQQRARDRAEHTAMVADIESMPPAAFYAAWNTLRVARYEATRPYYRESSPDEFGVNSFGSATADGRRYFAMRDRVRRDLRAFEDARTVI